MFTRLTRQSPWGAQIGCGITLAFIVAAPGLFIGYMTYTRDQSDNRNAMFAFAAVWVVVGILVLLSQIHQAIASRSPETRNTKYLGQFRMIDVERYDIAGGEQLEREATFQVPADIPVSLESPDRTIRWKIEVWGRVAWWPDFMHPFPVTVVGTQPPAR